MLSGSGWGQRPTITVWIYDSPMGAAAGQVRLNDLGARGAVEVREAVTVTWVPGAHRPRIGHLRHETSASAARGSVLGALVDLLTADDATPDRLGLLADALAGSGIDATFLTDVETGLQPGTSALLVLSSGADLDAVRPVIERGLARGDVHLVHAHLRPGGDATLRDVVRTAVGPSS
jgi:uncharacterized membrane protein